MSILICGSVAYDNIMVFPDRFRDNIIPEQIDILNISFTVTKMRREFGGCAGNIAYSLNLLDPELAIPMATVGKDFDAYADWMNKKNINQQYIKILKDTFTSQAFITTDLDNNQITAFHPGAMTQSHQNKVSHAKAVNLGIISPDGRDGMLQHAKDFANTNIPFMFDPGQSIPSFNGKELIAFIDKATWVIMNDYEWQLIKERTQLSKQQVIQKTKALIITYGSKGSTIYTKDKKYLISPVTAEKINDPTGCGDAYRAGLLYAIYHKMDWKTAGQIASLLGAIKIEQYGTQNHSFTLDEFKHRYKKTFGSTF